MIKCCKDCPNRKVGCHAHCPIYLTEKKKEEILARKERAEKDYLGAERRDYRRRLWQKRIKNGLSGGGY